MKNFFVGIRRYCKNGDTYERRRAGIEHLSGFSQANRNLRKRKRVVVERTLVSNAFSFRTRTNRFLSAVIELSISKKYLLVDPLTGSRYKVHTYVWHSSYCSSQLTYLARYQNCKMKSSTFL